MSIEYELVDESDPDPLGKIAGPQIYTDGSKINGRVGAAITWWTNDTESEYQTLSLHPSCSVYQAEMYALYRAVAMVKASREKVVNILSDSRSSLELLSNPRTGHPLAHAIRESTRNANAEGKEIRFYWLRAHVGIKGNERADELAKIAAQKADADYDYEKIPLSWIKNKIREETILKWQTRYDSSQTGAITKTFFPDAKKAYATIRKLKPTPVQTQIFTGHTGIAEYLHRFKLLQSPSCECDADKIESVWHIILECPRYEVARYDLEHKIETKLEKQKMHEIMENPEKRVEFLSFAEKAFREATSRHRSMNRKRNEETPPTAPTSAPTQKPQENPENEATTLRTTTTERMLRCAETAGKPGIRTRGVALFMDENTERLGIGFGSPWGKSSVSLSPGLANLINGSTSKTILKKENL
ncbi:Retrovirus-related Pol polyprotein from type-1 retrotransposable element R1 4 [Eumeta japonica]|uniref:Retrovirus-related Pol polyprotein from type-1 retrotransposable element R1 4 n=1 Tax=Eumeta variegata TaxID=151549 RepID=A0A4C2AAH9_EUMVA|nr:Retrovirus-related Pol polyprotein from type-1 retrotransposable element R1 4 [Eumeta japonica]